MTIRVGCDYCGEEYRVADDKAGRTLTCRACGERTEVPQPERRRPRAEGGSGGRGPARARRPAGRGGPSRSGPQGRRRKGSRRGRPAASGRNWVIIGAAAGGVVLLLLAVGLMLTGGDDSPAGPNNGNIADSTPGSGQAPPTGQTASPGTASGQTAPGAALPGAASPGAAPATQPGGPGGPGGAAGRAGTPGSGLNPAAAARLSGGPAAPGTHPAGGTSGPLEETRTAATQQENTVDPKVLQEIEQGWSTVLTIENPVDAGRLKTLDAPPRPVKWSLEPDPLTDPVEISDRPVSMPVQKGSRLWFPPAPSNVMAVGRLPAAFEIWSLKELEAIHTVQIDAFAASGVTLSPDGSRVATMAPSGTNRRVQVFKSATGEPVQEIPADHRLGGYYEFLDNDRLLMTNPASGGTAAVQRIQPLHVFSIETGQSIHEVDFGNVEIRSIRLSPGRRLAAARRLTASP